MKKLTIDFKKQIITLSGNGELDTFPYADKMEMTKILMQVLKIEYQDIKQAYISGIKQQLPADKEFHTVKEYMRLKNVSRWEVYDRIRTEELERHKIQGYTFVTEKA